MKPRSKKQINALAERLQIQTDLLEECIEAGAVIVESPLKGSAEFPPSISARLRRIQRICTSLDMDIFAGGVVVDLLERMDEMQRELDRLHSLLSPFPHNSQDI